MSSILKVDQLQDSGGNAIITSDGAGSITTPLITQGITEADQWRVTANITANADPISANLERVDTGEFAKIGTGMSVSSGYWTFPSTGLYQVSCTFRAEIVPNDNIVLSTWTTPDNSTYTQIGLAIDAGDDSTPTGAGSASSNIFFNVTDTSTHKIKFRAESVASGSYFLGDTNVNNTYFTFIRLGDSQ